MKYSSDSRILLASRCSWNESKGRGMYACRVLPGGVIVQWFPTEGDLDRFLVINPGLEVVREE